MPGRTEVKHKPRVVETELVPVVISGADVHFEPGFDEEGRHATIVTSKPFENKRVVARAHIFEDGHTAWS